MSALLLLVAGSGCAGDVGEPLGAAASDGGTGIDYDPSTGCPPDMPGCQLGQGGVGGWVGQGGQPGNPIDCPSGNCAPNTGGCTPQCTGGQICQQGQCVCAAGLSWCGMSCVDTQVNRFNCGACQQACETGLVCQAGQCVCPRGQTRCDDTCVDVQSSFEHCGACGTSCVGSQECVAGVCEGPSGPDGCGGAASGVTVSEVAVFQSVKIAIMQDRSAISTSQRNADVVSGRDALFRVYLEVEPGFSGRELSARVTLTSPQGEEEVFFDKERITVSSADADPTSTFEVEVPAEAIYPDSEYRVDVVECEQSAAAGSMMAPGYPTEGSEALGARETGVLRVSVVPVRANGRLPDTSEQALEIYRSYLDAMYPVSGVELTVESPIETSYPINWSSLLEQIRAKRDQDSPANDVYYYGMVAPTNSLAEYCNRGCTAGVGYVGSARLPTTRASVGLAFADENSVVAMAHELGHNHGREHAPCAPGGIQNGVDPSYPYSGATLGVWGYDSQDDRFYAPDDNTDMMGYCQDRWISDYTYQGILERVATVSGSSPFTLYAENRAIDAWRVLLVEEGEPRWSIPFENPSEAYGAAEEAEVLDAQGAVVDEVTVYRTEISDIDAYSILVPPPEPGWDAIRVQGAPALSFSEPVSVPSPQEPR